AMADERAIAAAAEGKRQGVEQDRLAGTGLAGEHGHTRTKVDGEALDEDDVADREGGEHLLSSWGLPALARLLLGAERVADSAAIVGRLDALLLEKAISVLVPAAVREIVPENGRRGLCFADEAHGKVRFGQPRQRFLDVARVLILGGDRLEPVDRGQVFAAL